MSNYADISSMDVTLVPAIGRGGAPAPLRRHCFPPARHRSIFLSDMHLGNRRARSDLIRSFLERNMADTVYLVGDIVDTWHPSGGNWTDDDRHVLRMLTALPQSGTRVVYVPGNHDSRFRHFAGTHFGGVEVRTEAVHLAGDGRRYLVVHGDCCDVFSHKAPVMARAGSLIETLVRALDRGQRRVLRSVRRTEWCGIEAAIARTNAAIRRHDRFEERLSGLARSRGLDGVICGHFHQPALHHEFGVVYANCGDWLGSNTALVEGFDGRFDLLEVMDRRAEPVIADQPIGAFAHAV